MRETSTNAIWVGLDVHQNSITAAILEPGVPRPAIVQLPGDLNATRRLFRKLAASGPVRACYEASGAGFVLQRTLERDGFSCEVIAPSLIPRKPGDARKTDRLDACRLAELYRGGLLTPVAVPDEQQEAVRQLVRTRLALIGHGTQLKHRIVRTLATHGHRFTGTKSNWTQAHRTWLTQLAQRLEGPLRIVLDLHLNHLEYVESQIRSLDAELERLSRQPDLREQVEALCCFRGIQTLTAMTLVTEIGDIHRFAGPRQLMAYSGLIPGERSSGEVQRRGPITKCGNAQLRRVLVESAWHYRHRSGADLRLNRQRQGQPAAVVAVAVKAQHRLGRRFWHLAQTKHNNKAVTAVARELCGFIWAALMAI